MIPVLINIPMPHHCTECKAWSPSYYESCVFLERFFDRTEADAGRQADCPLIPLYTDDPAERRMLEEAGFEL